MATRLLAQGPTGPIESIENLKRRQQAVYWRPIKDSDGNVTWLQTQPLPADPLSRNQYLTKGFRLSPPSEAELSGVAGSDSEKDAMRAEIDRLKAQIQDQKQQLTSAALGRRVINKQNLEIGNKEDSK